MTIKKNILKEVYFQDTNDGNLKEFTTKFLSSGFLWIYIALNPEKRWELIFEDLSKNQRAQFSGEYNKAFLFSRTYHEFTKLSLGKTITLKNLFLPHSAEASPEGFIKFNRSDDLRWKEALELIS